MNIALILAGGVGSRISSNIPKQYIEINSKPILVYTLETFDKVDSINKIFVVASKEFFPLIKEYANKFNINKFIDVIEGGDSRQKSSFLGLLGLKKYNIVEDDIILIHDACRALISPKIIEENISECKKHNAVNTCIEVKDTIFISKEKEILEKALDRNNLLSSQTPQTFRYEIILNAHERFKNEIVTDDVQLVNKLGYPVHLIPGDNNNFKITTDLDLLIFKEMVKRK